MERTHNLQLHWYACNHIIMYNNCNFYMYLMQNTQVVYPEYMMMMSHRVKQLQLKHSVFCKWESFLQKLNVTQ